MVLSDFYLDGAVGLFESWGLKVTQSCDIQEISYGPLMRNIKILRVMPLSFVWMTNWKWMRAGVGSGRTPK